MKDSGVMAGSEANWNLILDSKIQCTTTDSDGLTQLEFRYGHDFLCNVKPSEEAADLKLPTIRLIRVLE